jgi:hypothetical protein
MLNKHLQRMLTGSPLTQGKKKRPARQVSEEVSLEHHQTFSGFPPVQHAIRPINQWAHSDGGASGTAMARHRGLAVQHPACNSGLQWARVMCAQGIISTWGLRFSRRVLGAKPSPPCADLLVQQAAVSQPLTHSESLVQTISGPKPRCTLHPRLQKAGAQQPLARPTSGAALLEPAHTHTARVCCNDEQPHGWPHACVCMY